MVALRHFPETTLESEDINYVTKDLVLELTVCYLGIKFEERITSTAWREQTNVVHGLRKGNHNKENEH